MIVTDYSAGLERTPTGLQHAKEVEKVLREAKGCHGFWLVNNIAVIGKKIDDSIHRIGYRPTLCLLADTDSSFVLNLYSDIRVERDRLYQRRLLKKQP